MLVWLHLCNREAIAPELWIRGRETIYSSHDIFSSTYLPLAINTKTYPASPPRRIPTEFPEGEKQ